MTKNKFYLVVLALAGQLFLIGQAATEPLQAGDHASEEIILSDLAPERNRLNLVSFLPVTVEGEIVGRLVAYDDPKTPRTADYLELYDDAGRLVGFGWFDRFGIERTAVDRGILEERDELEGIFVILLEGEFI